MLDIRFDITVIVKSSKAINLCLSAWFYARPHIHTNRKETTYLLPLPLLASELSVGFAKALVTVVTEPSGCVDVEVTVTTGGAVVVGWPRLFVVLTNTRVESVLLQRRRRQ